MRKSNGTLKVIFAAVIMAAALFAGGCGQKSEGTKAPAGVETKDSGKDSGKDSEASEKAGGKDTKSAAKPEETELEKKFGKRASFQSAAVLVQALSENDMDTSWVPKSCRKIQL